MQNQKFDFSFQNFAHLWTKEWTKDSLRKVKKHSQIAFLKSKKWQRVMKKIDWKQKRWDTEQFIFANVAIYHGASKELPFRTLSQLGRLTRDPAYKEHTREIIYNNIIKFNGKFHKLDDLDYQKEIRKQLKNKSFEPLKDLKKVA